ncbi:MAG: hypothetical protein K0Q76_2002 [Panacagrimonas sp.]|jgi:hypothetical protein|nr:hypothetical protein [Panacagrimonas sp.]MCC2656894.1 hypothetical protein [Panacagrimonas sp.]
MDQKLGASSEDLLVAPVPGGKSLDSMQRQVIDLSHAINGWGSDLDPERRPGVPRDAAPALGAEALYPSMDAQLPTVKIHKSTEHGRLTPVFGSTCPPRGLSGLMRDRAYHYSEGRLARWMLLLLADRVDMVEHLAEDLVRLRPPNLVDEMGLRTEWRHNRGPFVSRIVLATAIATVAVALLRRRGTARTAAPSGAARSGRRSGKPLRARRA